MWGNLVQSYKSWKERRRLARQEQEIERRRLARISHRQDTLSSLKGMNLDPRGAEFTLSGRLQKEYHWSEQESAAALGEYFKFMALVGSSEEGLVPSSTVDKVWRIHMLFARQYMSGMCGLRLGKFVHRVASTNVARDEDALAHAWTRTLELYAETFGEPSSTHWHSRASSFSKVEILPDKNAARTQIRQHNVGRTSGTSMSRQVADHNGSSNSGPDLASMYLWYMVLIQPSYDARSCSHASSLSSDTATLASASAPSESTYDAAGGGDNYGGSGSGSGSCSSSSCSSSSCSSSSCSSSSCSSSS